MSRPSAAALVLLLTLGGGSGRVGAAPLLRGAVAPREDRRLSELGGSHECPDCRYAVVIRHCLRSDAPFSPEAQLYSGIGKPQWGTPELWCTFEGAESITQAVGVFLNKEVGFRPGKVKVVADTVMRDVQTAYKLLSGIYGGDPEGASVEYNHTVFYPPCPPVDDATAKRERVELIDTYPMPMGIGAPGSPGAPARFREVLAKMQDLIGLGVKDITSLPLPSGLRDVSDAGDVSGTVPIMQYFAQMLAFAVGLGGHQGDGIDQHIFEEPVMERLLNLTDAVLEMYAWQFYGRHVTRGPSTNARGGAALYGAIHRALGGAAADALPAGWAQMFVGHDGDIDELVTILNISYSAAPYAGSSDPTPPNIALLFTRHPNEEIDVHAIYPVLNGNVKNVTVKRVAVEPAAGWSLKELASRAHTTFSKYTAAGDCAKRLGVW